MRGFLARKRVAALLKQRQVPVREESTEPEPQPATPGTEAAPQPEEKEAKARDAEERRR